MRAMMVWVSLSAKYDNKVRRGSNTIFSARYVCCCGLLCRKGTPYPTIVNKWDPSTLTTTTHRQNKMRDFFMWTGHVYNVMMRHKYLDIFGEISIERKKNSVSLFNAHTLTHTTWSLLTSISGCWPFDAHRSFWRNPKDMVALDAILEVNILVLINQHMKWFQSVLHVLFRRFQWILCVAVYVYLSYTAVSFSSLIFDVINI